METLTTKRLVAILEKVPEKRFRIADLAPQLLDENGKVDIAKAIDQQGEISMAIVEVKSYVRATRAAVKALQYIGSEVDLEDWDDEIDEEDEE